MINAELKYSRLKTAIYKIIIVIAIHFSCWEKCFQYRLDLSKLGLNERNDGVLNEDPLSLERSKERSIDNKDKSNNDVRRRCIRHEEGIPADYEN